MSYVDYRQEAESNRRQVARCYYEARKSAKRAAKAYENARSYRRSVLFFSRHPELNKDNEAAAFESLVRTTLSLADTYLDSSFNETERARFYAGLARSYDELAARVEERLGL